MRKTNLGVSALLAGMLALAASAHAQEIPGPIRELQDANHYRVTVRNLTAGQPLAPALVIVHTPEFRLFAPGDAPSPGLAMAAEEGNPSLLMSELTGNPAVLAMYVAGAAPFGPGQTVSTDFEIRWPFVEVTVLGMLGSTNDGFYIDMNHLVWAFTGPTTAFARAWDAGSELNSEDCHFVPGPPCGSAGMHDPREAEGKITIHGGIHGIRDLDPTVLDWRNPVAQVSIELLRETPES